MYDKVQLPKFRKPVIVLKSILSQVLNLREVILTAWGIWRGLEDL